MGWQFRRVSVTLGVVAVAALVPAAVIGGCESDADLYMCDHYFSSTPCPPDAGADAGHCGDGGPDAGRCDAQPGDGGDASAAEGADGGMAAICNGQCVPKEPVGWFPPALLWVGPPDQAPVCPPSAPTVGYEGHAELIAEPFGCDRCACDPPVTSCDPPAAWSAADTSMCPAGPLAQRTPFTAPGGWDGSCTAANAIPAGQTCAGGLCTQSLDIEAPQVTAGACAPQEIKQPGTPRGEPRWQTFARACVGTASPQCTDPALTCVPAAPEADAAAQAFMTCIFRDGEQDCPAGYPSRHVVYTGVNDTRACTPCTCGAPTGASCTVLASAYSDAACSTLVVAALVRSGEPSCLGIVHGTALGSKSASVVHLDPGACAPAGGEPIGAVTPAGAGTFCCRMPSV